MKQIVLYFGVFLFSAFCFGSPIDDEIANLQIKVISPVTYKGLPLRGHSAEICRFLGFKIALNREYDSETTSESYELRASTYGGNSFGLYKQEPKEGNFYKSITCGR